LLSYALLKESISPRDLKIVTLAISFVAMISAYKFLQKDHLEFDIYRFAIGSIEAFVSIVLFAFTYIITRYLKEMNHSKQQYLSSTYYTILMIAIYMT